MKLGWWLLVTAVGCLIPLSAWAQGKVTHGVTVPVVLDHNRMLVDGEFQRQDGTWRKVRLWIDTGNPDFFISEALARDLGIDLSAADTTGGGRVAPMEIAPPAGVRIGGMPLNFQGVMAQVMFTPAWLFSTTHSDANLPSTVLQRYQIIFDYPKLELTVAEPGSQQHRGKRSPARVNPATGIVQMDALIGGDSLSFALDNGASYSFVADRLLERLSKRHPEWPRTTGALGCANIWGWWPGEDAWSVLRVPELVWGSAQLAGVGLVGLPAFFPGGLALDAWYSKKTAGPVDGFLGPNALKAFRVEIDYAGSAIYLEKGGDFDAHDMDLVGLTLRPEADGGYSVIGVAQVNGEPAVAGIEPGDRLLQVGEIKTTGATMGTVWDALRGRPGDVRSLVVERDGKQLGVAVKVMRFL